MAEADERRIGKRDSTWAHEKTSIVSVPRTDTGVHGGESQGLSGATNVREFGKLVPYLRKKGCLLRNGAGRSDSEARTV